MGKHINNSGFYQAFAEPGIYGPATIVQINNHKHMRQSFEASTILYVVLFCM